MVKNFMKRLMISGIKEIQGKEVRVIEGGFGEGQKCILAADIAIQHDIENTNDLNKLINKNIGRFNKNDLLDLLLDSDLKSFAKENGLITSNRTKNIYLLSERGYAKLASIMKSSKTAKIVLKEYFNSSIVAEPSSTKEYKFYEDISEHLEIYEISHIVQYPVLQYRIDLYLPSLNIAIEYDESSHKHYEEGSDIKRQNNIEKELGCKFIRVTDKYSINRAIAITMKKILEIKGEF